MPAVGSTPRYAQMTPLMDLVYGARHGKEGCAVGDRGDWWGNLQPTKPLYGPNLIAHLTLTSISLKTSLPAAPLATFPQAIAAFLPSRFYFLAFCKAEIPHIPPSPRSPPLPVPRILASFFPRWIYNSLFTRNRTRAVRATCQCSTLPF